MKKLIAPIIISIMAAILIITYGLGLTYASELSPFPWLFKIGIIFIFAYVIWTLGKVLMERIREIKEEDEDDLGKY